MATSSVTSVRRWSPEFARLLDEFVDGEALLELNLVELLRELGHASVGIALGQHLGAPAPQLVEHLTQAGDLLAVGIAEAPAQHAAQRVVEVAPGQQVVGEGRQQVVGIEVGELLGAVPFRVVVAGAHVRVLSVASPPAYLRPRYRARAPDASLFNRLVRWRPSRRNSNALAISAGDSASAASGPASLRVGGSSSGTSARTAR